MALGLGCIVSHSDTATQSFSIWRDAVRRASVLLLLLVEIGAIAGCDITRPKPNNVTTHPLRSSADDIGKDIPLDDPSKNLPLTDLRLAKSDARRLTGDLRPFWVVQGRIQNNTVLPVKDIHLRITLRYRGTITDVDSADVILKDEIFAGTTTSFMQAIQILPPDKAWEWDCTVLEARTLNVP